MITLNPQDQVFVFNKQHIAIFDEKSYHKHYGVCVQTHHVQHDYREVDGTKIAQITKMRRKWILGGTAFIIGLLRPLLRPLLDKIPIFAQLSCPKPDPKWVKNGQFWPNFDQILTKIWPKIGQKWVKK